MAFFPWQKALCSKTVWFSLLVMLTLSLTAVLTPWLAPHDPYKMDVSQSDLPPMWSNNPFNPGRPDFPLGSDRAGRDILSRFLYGTRTAVVLLLIAVPLAALIGTLVGVCAGYVGGKIELVLMRLTDVINSLPAIMFLVIVVLILRELFDPSWLTGMITLVIGFAAVAWVGLARLIRSSVLKLKGQSFVEAARSLGASPWHIITKHLLPNMMQLILVWMIINIPAVILLEAVLGYIGVDVTKYVESGEFSIVSWGGLFFSGRSALRTNPFILIIPSFCILLISMSFILLGDFLSETTGEQMDNWMQ